ncbi:hypothetical protein [Streptomyces sp. TR06-5]|uniref:hypothetical protein n=1 Tax=unclassified Streptomyces TaxID=2593676 RepID=UPI0039A1EB6B
MAKQKRQDRNRQKAGSAERAQEQPRKDAPEGRGGTGSPADVARRGKKPSFGHN